MRSLLAVPLVLVLSACLSEAQVDIDIESHIRCTLLPNNEMYVEIAFYDKANKAVRFVVLDKDNITQPNCFSSGSGVENDRWIIRTRVNLLEDTETNICGMQAEVAAIGKDYTWRTRHFPGQPGDPFTGRSFWVTSTCNSVTDVTDTVEAGVGYSYNPFLVEPQDPKTVTGTNTYAEGAALNVDATFYPDGVDTPTEFKGAAGYYAKNCKSATDQNIQNDVTPLADERGCKPDGTPAFVQTSEPGDTPITLSSTITATKQGDQAEQHVQCEIARCETPDHSCCTNPCLADPNNEGICENDPNVRDTGRVLQTSFSVQNVPAQELHAARPTLADTPITEAFVDSDVTLVARMHPYGINAPAAFRDAEGFFVYSCTLSPIRGRGQQETFIDDTGCPSENSLFEFTGGEGFKLSEQDSDLANNLNVLVTGRATIKSATRTGRVFIECQTGLCNNKDHNYVTSGRCNSADIPAGECFQVGLQGLATSFAIIDPTTPAYQLTQTNDDGNPVADGFEVPVGEGVGFGAAVVPGASGQSGNALKNVAGVYVRSCTATITSPDGTVEAYDTIDDNGCQIPGTPISFSKPCTGASEFSPLPPHKVDCGQVKSSVPGEVKQDCVLGGCSEPSIFCDDRCAAGPIKADSPVIDDPGLPPVTSSFVAKEEPDTDTAKESERLRNLITGLAAGLSVLFAGGIGALAMVCLACQRSGRIC